MRRTSHFYRSRTASSSILKTIWLQSILILCLFDPGSMIAATDCKGGREESYCTAMVSLADTPECNECRDLCEINATCAEDQCDDLCNGFINPTCPVGWKYTQQQMIVDDNPVEGCCPEACVEDIDGDFNCLGCPDSIQSGSDCSPPEDSCPSTGASTSPAPSDDTSTSLKLLPLVPVKLLRLVSLESYLIGPSPCLYPT